MSSSTPVALGHTLSIADFADVVLRGRPVAVDANVAERVKASRAPIDAIALAGDAAPSVYGINTGFGALAETRISASDVRELQLNLVRSHAVGLGEPLPSPRCAACSCSARRCSRSVTRAFASRCSSSCAAC